MEEIFKPLLSGTSPSPPKFNVNLTWSALAPMDEKNQTPNITFGNTCAETLRFRGAGVQHSACCRVWILCHIVSIYCSSRVQIKVSDFSDGVAFMRLGNGNSEALAQLAAKFGCAETGEALAWAAEKRVKRLTMFDRWRNRTIFLKTADVLDINYQFDHSRICLDQCLPQLDISGQVWGQSHPLVCQHCLWTSSSRQSNAKRLRFSSCVWPALARVDFWRIDLRSPRSNPGRFRASRTLCLWWSTGLLGRTLGSTTAGASLWAPICCFQGCKDGNFVCTDHIISHYITLRRQYVHHFLSNSLVFVAAGCWAGLSSWTAWWIADPGDQRAHPFPWRLLNTSEFGHHM